MTGLAKRFVVPGFCCEWLLMKDSSKKITHLREILRNLQTLYGMPPTPLLKSLKFFFEMQNEEVSKCRMEIVKKNYEICEKLFGESLRGWQLGKVNASFFGCVRFSKEDFREDVGVNSDVDLVNLLARDEGLLVTPGSFVNQGDCIRFFLMNENPESYVMFVERLRSFYEKNCV